MVLRAGRLLLMLVVAFCILIEPVLFSFPSGMEAARGKAILKHLPLWELRWRAISAILRADSFAQTFPIKKRQDDYSLRLERARQLMRAGAYDDAIGILEALVAERPQILTATEMLSTCYIRAGRARDAIDFILKKLENAPGNYSLIKNLGLAYLELGDRKRAVEAWRDLLSADEKSAIYYGVVAKLERENGLYEEAVETLREGQRFDSYRARYTRELVGLLRAMGREKDAFVEAFKSVVLYGDDGGWERLRDAINIFSSSKDKKQLAAIADSIASSSKSDDPVTLVATALLFADMGRYEIAYERIEKALSKPSARAPVYSFLEIFSSTKVGRWSDESDAFLNKVLSLYSSAYPDASETSGIILLKAQMDRERARRNSRAGREALKGVIDLVDKLISKSSRDEYSMQARIFKARVLIEDLHDFRGGLRVLEEVKWKSRNDSLVAAELFSRALIGSGSWKKVESFTHLLEERGDSAFAVLAYYERGVSLFYRGRYDEALKELSALAKNYPWSKWANDALGLAVKIRKATLEGNTKALDLYRKALYLQYRGRYPEAMDSLDVLVKGHRHSFLVPYALVHQADMLNKLARFGEEEIRLEKVSEAYPGSVLAPVALERLAALKERSDHEEALHIYGKILDRYPDYPFIERVRRKFVIMRKELGEI